jgi:cation transport ATPase
LFGASILIQVPINAETVQVESSQNHISGYPTYQELASKAVWVYSLRVNENDKVRTASDYEPGSVERIKRLITSHPNLFVVFVSLLILIAIIAMEAWAPWIGEYHDKHKRLVQAVLFTGIYFGVYVYSLRQWRRRSVFWPSICVLFLLHVLGVFFYSTHVQPILVWQWPIVGLLEYYGTAFFLAWSTRRFSHHARHTSANSGGGT